MQTPHFSSDSLARPRLAAGRAEPQEDRKRRRVLTGMIAVSILALALLLPASTHSVASLSAAPAVAPTVFDGPTHSSPIALSAGGEHIWVVNPDDDSVSVLGTLGANPTLLGTYPVGDEPQSIALGTNDDDPSQYYVYVANAAENSVTILHVTNSTPNSLDVALEKTLVTGAEPWNIVTSPDGRRVFVANSAQDTITVIRTDTRGIAGSIDLRDSICNDPDRDRHFQPRGLAVTEDSARLYVTRFLSFTDEGGVQGDDAGKEAIVCQLDIPFPLPVLPSVARSIELGPQDTLFAIDSNGDGVNDPTLAFPNQLQSIVIRDNQAFLPNIAASPSRPLKFNVDTQAFVNVIDNVTTGIPADASADKFLNLHRGAIDPEPGKKRLFFANPWAIAFTTDSGEGDAYVVSAGSDLLVKTSVDATGTLSFTVDANTTRYIDLNDPADPATSGDSAGKNPLGIVIVGDYAYTMNFISRNVSVVELSTDSVVNTVRLTDLPPAGSQAEQLLIGKEIFFSSRGNFDRPPGTSVSTEDRLSSEGWQNCGSCHFAGLTDGVIWQFVPGPRKSIPMNGSWSPHNPDDQRMLNYSAVFDEVEDFEINIRNVSGPGALAEPIAGSVQDPNHGLLISDTGDINFAPAVINAFTVPNGNRAQHTVTLPGSDTSWPALTAMREWIRFSIRTPNGALTEDELVDGGANAGAPSDLSVDQGRRLFFEAGCHSCHGGTKWTISNKDFVSPPAAEDLATETGEGVVGAQYLDGFLADIESFNLGVPGEGNPIGDDVGAVEVNTGNQLALGKDHDGDGKGDGYNIPSLLGIWQLPPYYHNGACETLACVLSNETHRQAGLRTGRDDKLGDPGNQARLISFLSTLDAETAFPLNLYIDRHDIFTDPPRLYRDSEAVVGVNVSLFGTKADLDGLIADLGLSNLNVRFDFDGNGAPVDVPLTADDFDQDFGQAVITTTWPVPAGTGLGNVQLTVTVDPEDALPEDDEDDNSASRNLRLHNAPPDRTPPVIARLLLSDDDTFNDSDPITVKAALRAKIQASDPEVGGSASGVDAYCLVNYRYSVVSRRWVEQECEFKELPEATEDDTWVVETEVQNTFGVAYTFLWVRDAAGNISRVPAFDVISFIPDEVARLNRNDARILRIPLEAGESLDLTFTPDFGDIDVAVFDDFTIPNPTLIDFSANRGDAAEQVELTGPGFFQVEIVSRENARFRTDVAPGDGVAPVRTASVTAPLVDEEPLIFGPPARLTAIDDDFVGDDGDTEVFLPIVERD